MRPARVVAEGNTRNAVGRIDMVIIPKFQEEFSAKLPALTLLNNLGWSFLSPEQALAARGGRQDEVVLRQILRTELQKRTFGFAGQTCSLSDKAIDNLIAEVCSPALNEGLLAAIQPPALRHFRH